MLVLCIDGGNVVTFKKSDKSRISDNEVSKQSGHRSVVLKYEKRRARPVVPCTLTSSSNIRRFQPLLVIGRRVDSLRRASLPNL